MTATPGKIVMMEDHDRAYSAWKEHGVRDRTLVHIDAHIDFGWVPEMDLDEIGLSGKWFDSSSQEAPLLNPLINTRKKMVNIGNYICPAMRDDVVKKFYWVVPDASWRSPRGRKHIIRQLRQVLKIKRYAGEKLEIGRDRMRCRIFGKEVIVCSLEGLEHIDEPVLLDIDVDFMLTKSIWDDLNPERAPWILPEELFKRLSPKITTIDVLTIAYSVEGGFTPLAFKHLGDELRRLFVNDEPEDIRKDEQCKIDASVYFNLSLMYLDGKDGDTKKAGELYREAVRRDKTYYTAYNNYGLLYLRYNRLDRAEREYKKFLRIDGDNPAVLSGLGYIALNKRAYDKAEEFFSRCLLLDRHHFAARLGNGIVYFKTGRLKDAEELFLGLKKDTPDDAEAYWWLGRMADKKGEAALAIDCYKNSVMRGWEWPLVHFLLMRLYVKRGLYLRALEELQRAFQSLRTQ